MIWKADDAIERKFFKNFELQLFSRGEIESWKKCEQKFPKSDQNQPFSLRRTSGKRPDVQTCGPDPIAAQASLWGPFLTSHVGFLTSRECCCDAG